MIKISKIFLINNTLLKRFISIKQRKSLEQGTDNDEIIDDELIDEEQANDHKRNKIYRHKKAYRIPSRLPELVTSIAKYQIYHLYNFKPDTYDFHFFLNNYPILGAASINRILKTKPRIRNLKDIKVHDDNVLKNWANLINGEYDHYPSFSFIKLDPNKSPLYKLHFANGRADLPFNFDNLYQDKTFINPTDDFILDVEHANNKATKKIKMSQEILDKEILKIDKGNDETKMNLKGLIKNEKTRNTIRKRETNFLNILPPLSITNYIEEHKHKRENTIENMKIQLNKHYQQINIELKKIWETVII